MQEQESVIEDVRNLEKAGMEREQAHAVMKVMEARLGRILSEATFEVAMAAQDAKFSSVDTKIEALSTQGISHFLNLRDLIGHNRAEMKQRLDHLEDKLSARFDHLENNTSLRFDHNEAKLDLVHKDLLIKQEAYQQTNETRLAKQRLWVLIRFGSILAIVLALAARAFWPLLRP